MVLPLIFEPESGSTAELLSYIEERKTGLLDKLYEHGALLFRGFAVDGPGGFRDAFRCFAPALRSYVGGDSPREAVDGKVYTSTSYPPMLKIPLHNEMSYTRDYPSLIAFYCEVASEAGGETPLADCREVLRNISPSVLTRFANRRLRYIQNLPDRVGLGRSWRATFETDDRARVEEVLRARGAGFQWKENGTLCTSEVVDPIVVHPRTGDAVLFSQAHMWHISGLDSKTREALEKIASEDELYHHCTFGDGTPIADEDLDEMRRVFDSASATFPWQPGDVLLIDNLLVAHGRRPYRGARRILVAMG